jgi:hypothetical protein
MPRVDAVPLGLTPPTPPTPLMPPNPTHNTMRTRAGLPVRPLRVHTVLGGRSAAIPLVTLMFVCSVYSKQYSVLF